MTPGHLLEPAERLFGSLPNGDAVRQVRLETEALAVSVLTFGATLRAIDFRGRPVTLGCDTLDAYRSGSAYVGAVAGRHANRIRGGRFVLDGTAHQLTLNEAGATHLHGGTCGFSHRNWQVLWRTASAICLTLDSADGEEGYPGRVAARCTYRLQPPATLAIELEAVSDRATIVNLALHSYFNLDGAPTIADHDLTIPAAHYLPIDAMRIPTGERAPVAGTPFDFRTGRRIGEGAYDHNFVLADAALDILRPAARLVGPRTGTALDIQSTEPGLQLYDGHVLDAARDGLPRYAGLCLEPQRFPNSPNEPGFPGAVLRPGETYRQRTEYRFSHVGASHIGDGR